MNVYFSTKRIFLVDKRRCEIRSFFDRGRWQSIKKLSFVFASSF